MNVPGIANLSFAESKTRRGRVVDKGKTSPTIQTESIPNVVEPWTWKIDGELYRIRIRKLTPKESWRLMGFKDEQFDKAEKVSSNSALYKQAGNSIVVNVLESIFAQLL